MIKKKTSERQEQIIDEAISIIHNDGVAGLTIRTIAKQVEITEGAIYKHFESKDDILIGIFQRINNLEFDLRKKLDESTNPFGKLRNFIFFHFELFVKKPELVSIIFSEELFTNNSTITQDLIHMIKHRQSMLKSILNEGMNSGEFGKYDSDIISTMIQGYIRLTVISWKRSGYSFSLINRGNQFIETLNELLTVKK